MVPVCSTAVKARMWIEITRYLMMAAIIARWIWSLYEEPLWRWKVCLLLTYELGSTNDKVQPDSIPDRAWTERHSRRAQCLVRATNGSQGDGEITRRGRCTREQGGSRGQWRYTDKGIPALHACKQKWIMFIDNGIFIWACTYRSSLHTYINTNVHV